MTTMGESGVPMEAVGAAQGISTSYGAAPTANGTSFGGSRMKSRVGALSALWESHSVFDAWLVAAAAQIGFVLITMPYTLSQMGYAWGIAACILYGLLGAWTVYVMVWLYLEFKSRLDLQGKVCPEKYILQYHEVIGGLTGRWGRKITKFFVILMLFMVAIIHLIACARQRAGVKHAGAHDKVEFFTGVATVLSTFGGHGITIEILEQMKRPSAYKYVCIAVLFYALLVTIPSAVAVYWSAGDILLKQSNAFSVLPKSGWQTLAISTLVAHQAIGFVIFTHPIFLVCEKAVGVHTGRFLPRVLSRIPVVALIWFFALAVPFFGPINSLLGSFGVAIGMYMIPAIAFLITYRTKSARENSLVKPPWFLPTWSLLFLANVLVILWTVVIGVGFGGWGGISNLVRQVHSFGFFDRCFQCPTKPK